MKTPFSDTEEGRVGQKAPCFPYLTSKKQKKGEQDDVGLGL